MFVTPCTLIMTSLLLPFSLSYYFPELFVTLGFIGHKPGIQIIFLITFRENLPSILSKAHQTKSWIVDYPCLSSCTINNSWQVIRWSFDLCRLRTEIKEKQDGWTGIKLISFGGGRIDLSESQTKHTQRRKLMVMILGLWQEVEKLYSPLLLFLFSSFSMLKVRVIERLMREILDPKPSFRRVEDGQTSDFKRPSTSWNSTLQELSLLPPFEIVFELVLWGRETHLTALCLPFLCHHDPSYFPFFHDAWRAKQRRNKINFPFTSVCFQEEDCLVDAAVYNWTIKVNVKGYSLGHTLIFHVSLLVYSSSCNNLQLSRQRVNP